MGMWTESEFQRVALGTKLSERTLAACREVLIEGETGVDVAAKHKMFPAQISRALGVLRDKQEDMVKSAKVLKKDGKLLKFTAAAVAKSMVGDGLVIADAEPGKAYEGPVIVNTHGFVVQKVGRGAVMHDLGKLDRIPPLNAPLSISYPQNQDKALVTEVSPANERANDLGR